jgi:hypothetical protein
MLQGSRKSQVPSQATIPAEVLNGGRRNNLSPWGAILPTHCRPNRAAPGKSATKPDRVSADLRESGYAAAIIILSAAALESFVQRDRYFSAKRYSAPISELSVAMYLKQAIKYPRYRRVEELFDVRNAVVHNHIWLINFENPPSGGRRHKLSVLVPKTHRLKQIPVPQVKIPRSKLVRFNLNPVRLDRTDVQKALSVVIHALQFISTKGHNPVPLVSNAIGFRGHRVRLANFATEVDRALKVTIRS